MQVKPKTLKRSFVNHVVMALVSLIFGGIFLLFSTNEKYYESSECQMLKKWSYIYAWIAVIQAILGLTLTIIFYLSHKQDLLETSAGCAETIFGFILLIIWIFLIIALFKREPCGLLGTFVLILLVVFIVYVVLFCFFVYRDSAPSENDLIKYEQQLQQDEDDRI